jgi:RNA polymerase sigma-70 factor (ECF subfamily)
MGMKENQEKMRALLDQLSPKDRAAVVLRYWYDYSYEEISESLSLTVSAVKSRLHRARKDLAEAYQNQQSQTILSNERTHNESPAF